MINLIVHKRNHQIYLNYYNNNRRSPLYYAIYNHGQEIKHRRKMLTKMTKQRKDPSAPNSPLYNIGSNEWVYSVLTQDPQRLASVNFPVIESYKQVISPLGLAIQREQLDIGQDLVKKGAILNCHDISFLPNVLSRAGRQEITHSEEWIRLLKQAINKSQISMRSVFEHKNGNNPIHVLFQSIQLKWLKRIARQEKRARQQLQRREKLIDKNKKRIEKQVSYMEDEELNLKPYLLGLEKLFTMCRDWMFDTNDDKMVPVSILFEAAQWEWQHRSGSGISLTQADCEFFQKQQVMKIICQTLMQVYSMLNDDQGMFN